MVKLKLKCPCSSPFRRPTRSSPLAPSRSVRLRPLSPQNPTQPPPASTGRYSAARDGGHRGRAGTGRVFRRRSASRSLPTPLHCRRQAQAQVVQARADAAPARCPDPRHAGIPPPPSADPPTTCVLTSCHRFMLNLIGLLILVVFVLQTIYVKTFGCSHNQASFLKLPPHYSLQSLVLIIVFYGSFPTT